MRIMRTENGVMTVHEASRERERDRGGSVPSRGDKGETTPTMRERQDVPRPPQLQQVPVLPMIPPYSSLRDPMRPGTSMDYQRNPPPPGATYSTPPPRMSYPAPPPGTVILRLRL